MSWTLEYDATTQSLTTWGLEGVVIELRSFAAGTVSMTAPAMDMDAAPLFADGAAGIIRHGDTVVFRGRFSREHRTGAGHTERVSYVLRDAWHDMTRRFYSSPTSAYANLFNGATTVAGQLEAMVDAAAAAGVAIQFGTAANMSYSPRAIELRDARLSDVLIATRRFVPDAQSWMDYTTSPTTIHFVRRADAAAVSMAITDLTRVEVEPMHDLVVSAVVLRYARMLSTGGAAPALNVIVDKYPIDATGAEENAVVVTMDLRGNQLQTQELSTNNISLSSRAWWARFFPWIAPGNDDLVEGEEFDFDLQERLMQNVDSEWVTDTTGSVYEVVDGGVPGWLSEARQVLCRATVKDFTLDGTYYGEAKLETTVEATSLTGGIYTKETVAAEAVPVGIAQQLHAALSVLHYAGSLARTDSELTVPLTHCAKVLNLTGGAAEARGWTTMRAVIQSARYDIDSATTEFTFGPPEHLGASDLLEMARLRGSSGVEVVGLTAPSGSAGGVRRTAGSNSVPPPPRADGAHPFYIYPNGEIHVGVINGSIIPQRDAEPIGVGGPALTLSGDGYVYLRAVLTITFHEATHFMSSWVYDGGFEAPLIEVIGSSTPLTEEYTSGELTTYQLIAQIVDGVVQRAQACTTNMNLGVCDRSDGTDEGKMVEGVWTTA